MKFRELLEESEEMNEIVDYKTMSVKTLNKKLQAFKMKEMQATTPLKKRSAQNQIGIIKAALKERGESVNEEVQEEVQEEGTLVLEGLTLDIVATFKSDGKAGSVTIRKDEIAEVYHLSNSYKDKGTLFTASQWKEMKNAMKLYEKI